MAPNKKEVAFSLDTTTLLERGNVGRCGLGFGTIRLRASPPQVQLLLAHWICCVGGCYHSHGL